MNSTTNGNSIASGNRVTAFFAGLEEENSTSDKSTIQNASSDHSPYKYLYVPDPTERDTTPFGVACDSITSALLESKNEESSRNFGIGRTFLAFAEIQSASTSNNHDGKRTYGKDDWKLGESQIIGRVRRYVPIKPTSLRVGEWAIAVSLSDAIASHLGSDHASQFSMYELLAVLASYKFSYADLTGEIRAGWLDFFRSVASTRLSGQSVSSKSFESLRVQTIANIADGKLSGMTDADKQHALYLENAKARKAADKARTDGRNAVDSSIAESLIKLHATPAEVLMMLEAHTATIGQTLPNIGINPATMSADDAKTLVTTLLGLGRVDILTTLARSSAESLATVESRKHDVNQAIASIDSPRNPNATDAGILKDFPIQKANRNAPKTHTTRSTKATRTGDSV